MPMRAALALACFGVGAIACTNPDRESTATTAPTVTGSDSAPTSATSEVSATSTVVETTTVTTASTTAPPTTPESTVTPATTAPPTIAAPTTTTTEPLSAQELLLRGDGLGSARFGAEPQGVIDYVTSILGGNTSDTGWVDPLDFAVCDGTVARRVDWGVLSLLFSDLSNVADGRRHFMGYEYGRVGEIGDEPVGLRTPAGVTLGSRVVDLLAEFPEASVNPGEEGINIPPNFYVSDNFYGLVTGTDPDDFVTVIFGGYGCGE